MSTGINDPAQCQWCGNFHKFKCPLVKSIEYADNGLTKRVEFFAPNDYNLSAFGPASVLTRIPDGPAGSHGVATTHIPMPGPDH